MSVRRSQRLQKKQGVFDVEERPSPNTNPKVKKTSVKPAEREIKIEPPDSGDEAVKQPPPPVVQLPQFEPPVEDVDNAQKSLLRKRKRTKSTPKTTVAANSNASNSVVSATKTASKKHIKTKSPKGTSQIKPAAKPQATASVSDKKKKKKKKNTLKILKNRIKFKTRRASKSLIADTWKRRNKKNSRSNIRKRKCAKVRATQPVRTRYIKSELRFLKKSLKRKSPQEIQEDAEARARMISKLFAAVRQQEQRAQSKLKQYKVRHVLSQKGSFPVPAVKRVIHAFNDLRLRQLRQQAAMRERRRAYKLWKEAQAKKEQRNIEISLSEGCTEKHEEYLPGTFDKDEWRPKKVRFSPCMPRYSSLLFGARTSKHMFRTRLHKFLHRVMRQWKTKKLGAQHLPDARAAAAELEGHFQIIDAQEQSERKTAAEEARAREARARGKRPFLQTDVWESPYDFLKPDSRPSDLPSSSTRQHHQDRVRGLQPSTECGGIPNKQCRRIATTARREDYQLLLYALARKQENVFSSCSEDVELHARMVQANGLVRFSFSLIMIEQLMSQIRKMSLIRHPTEQDEKVLKKILADHRELLEGLTQVGDKLYYVMRDIAHEELSIVRARFPRCDDPLDEETREKRKQLIEKIKELRGQRETRKEKGQKSNASSASRGLRSKSKKSDKGKDADGEGGEEDNRIYCFCNEPSFGEMILCDNTNCAYQWFHFYCVKLKKKPAGSWYCPTCRISRDVKQAKPPPRAAPHADSPGPSSSH